MIGPDVLSVDFETRSTVDLRRQGLYRYAEDPTTDVLCMAYAWGDGEVGLWTPQRHGPHMVVIDESPNPWRRIFEHVEQGLPMRAHNAQFERVIWREVLGPRYGFPVPELSQWYCTAAEAAAMALPRSLAQAGRVLNIPQPKDDGGHKLMMQMCKPRRPRKGEDPDGVYWWEDDDRLQRLYEYCRQDVRAEREVAKRVRRLPPFEREVYLLDQEINDRGVQVDIPLVRAAQRIVTTATERANAELAKLTDGDVDAVTKVADLTAWLREEGLDIPGVAKDVVRDTLEDEMDLPDDVRRALEIRQETAKSSTGKLDAFERWVNADGRARGMFLYHGASTGRDSGKGPQPQNFPRGEVKNVERFIPEVMAGEYDLIAMEEPPLVVVSSMLRPMLKAAEGHRLMGGDYGQIEARVLGWMAGEPYLDGEYERMAAAIYGVPVEEIENPSERRTIGKNTVLGCGYQMGHKTYRAQAKKQSGIDLPKELCERAVNTYRELKPGIVGFWSEIEEAAMRATLKPGSVVAVGAGGAVRFTHRGEFLWCVLPSGRALAYALPRVAPRRTPWGEMKDGLSFMGVNGYTRKWERRHAYGGLLTENAVSAAARDLLMAAMRRLEARGYPVVLRVHDELVVEVPDGEGSLEEFLDLMQTRPKWAREVPVLVEGWEGERYRK